MGTTDIMVLWRLLPSDPTSLVVDYAGFRRISRHLAPANSPFYGGGLSINGPRWLVDYLGLD